MRLHWLGLLEPHLDDRITLDELDRDLRSSVGELRGIDPHRGYMLVPFDEDFELGRRGSATTVSGLLVAPDAHGEEVALAWDDGGAWWDVLPPTAEPDEILFVPELATVRITASPLPWPDVWLELRVGGDLGDGAVGRLLSHIERWRAAWNADGAGLIHNVSEPSFLSRSRIEVHIDFGSAPRSSLEALLGRFAALDLGAELIEVCARGFGLAPGDRER